MEFGQLWSKELENCKCNPLWLEFQMLQCPWKFSKMKFGNLDNLEGPEDNSKMAKIWGITNQVVANAVNLQQLAIAARNGLVLPYIATENLWSLLSLYLVHRNTIFHSEMSCKRRYPLFYFILYLNSETNSVGELLQFTSRILQNPTAPNFFSYFPNLSPF